MPKKHEDAVHAFHILNYFVGDLVAASQVRRLSRSPSVTSRDKPNTVACVDGLCLGYLFLTLDKWTEFYDRCDQPSSWRLAPEGLAKGEDNAFPDERIGNGFNLHPRHLLIAGRLAEP